MAIKSLDELKSAFAKQEAKSDNTGYWDKFYPFWKMDFDQTAIVRYLPDQDESNPMGFVVENLSHKLSVNGRERTVPCLKMYGESCPCCELSRKYYDQKDEKMGLKFWRRQEFIGQILVLSSPFDYPIDENENPVRLIMLGPKIFKLIQASFASGDLEENPTDFSAGYDFRIKKSKQGQFADYTLSKFAPKQSAISEQLLQNLELHNLADWRTRRIERDAMELMIQADLTGSSYSEKGEGETNTTTAATSSVTTARVETPKAGIKAEDIVTSSSEETTNTPAAASSPKGEDVLARIRNRVAAKKQA
jgi:hypothetical protein